MRRGGRSLDRQAALWHDVQRPASAADLGRDAGERGGHDVHVAGPPVREREVKYLVLVIVLGCSYIAGPDPVARCYAARRRPIVTAQADTLGWMRDSVRVACP